MSGQMYNVKVCNLIFLYFLLHYTFVYHHHANKAPYNKSLQQSNI